MLEREQGPGGLEGIRVLTSAPNELCDLGEPPTLHGPQFSIFKMKGLD